MKQLLALFLLTLTLTACHSTKDVTSTTVQPTTSTTNTAYVNRVRANAQKANALTAKLKLDLNGMGKNISLNGSLKMKRDEVIQMSLTLLGFEVARLEFTPKDVLIVNRAEKTYLRTDYAALSFLKSAGLDFYALQALFWNELFVPGVTTNDLASKFRVSASGSHTLLAADNVKSLNYDFLTITSTALIDCVTVEGSSASQDGKFTMKYADFATLGGKQFPTSLTCSLTAEKKTRSIALTLSNLNNNSDWESHTTLSNKYKAMKGTSLLDSLLK